MMQLLVGYPMFSIWSRTSSPFRACSSKLIKSVTSQSLLLSRTSNIIIGEMISVIMLKLDGIKNLNIGKWKMICRALIRNIRYLIVLSDNGIIALNMMAARNIQRSDSLLFPRASSNYLAISVFIICFLIFDRKV